MITFLRLYRQSLRPNGVLVVYGLNGANPLVGSGNLAHNIDHFNNGSTRYAKSLGYFYFAQPLRSRLYGPVMDEAADRFDPEASIREPYERAAAADPLDRMLYADTQVRLSDHPVMILDRMTMADGLEVRAPFMDHEIAQFAARLPVRLKVRGQCTRYLQRRLEDKYLQDSALNQPKQGFQSALPYMLKHKYELLTGLFLRNSQLARDGILLQQPMDRLVQKDRIGKADHGNRLWLLLNSALWYRMHIHGATVADLSAQIQDSAHIAIRGVPA